MLVLVGQIQHHASLSWDGEHMHPHAGVEPPACGRVLDALTFLGRKGGFLLLEGGANAILQSGIHQQADGHHHQQCPEAFRLVEREGGGQTLRGFQEAKAAFRLGLPFGAVEHGVGGELPLVPCVRREENTALLGTSRLAVREPRREGPCAMGDELVGLGSRAWAPPLPRECGVVQTGLWWRNAVGKFAAKRESACWASASQANAVRHRFLKPLASCSLGLSPCLSTVCWA